jgi:CheY-like chemotaxis protein
MCAQAAKCHTVLVVEDDPAIRNFLKLALEAEGYRVETATQGQEALDMLPKLPTPCLILLDLMMPVMDGWEFARALRKDMILASIPVALVTAYAEEAKTFSGAQTVIRKPIDLDLLLQVVRRFCG